MPADTGVHSMATSDKIFWNYKQAPGKVLNKNQSFLLDIVYMPGKFTIILIPCKRYIDFMLHKVRY